ncbi:MAG: hypothetical protein LQ338_007941 [Usnochroma carphineum]|nr:MAG: hypothetical protein LQ338_007941 [Usnochroma carphineum]
MSANESDYSNYVVYGPDTNCTLALCPVELSVYQYRPTLPGNICFVVFFGLALLIHIAMGIKWRTWFFHARFQPRLYYWIFIPCDILSLILQAIGGALSSTSSGGSKTAVDVSIAGLSFQVFTLCVFIALAFEYAYRWFRARRAIQQPTPLSRSFKVMVLVAVYLLMIAHPGPVFQGFDDKKVLQDSTPGIDLERQKEAM